MNVPASVTGSFPMASTPVFQLNGLMHGSISFLIWDSLMTNPTTSSSHPTTHSPEPQVLQLQACGAFPTHPKVHTASHGLINLTIHDNKNTSKGHLAHKVTSLRSQVPFWVILLKWLPLEATLKWLVYIYIVYIYIHIYTVFIHWLFVRRCFQALSPLLRLRHVFGTPWSLRFLWLTPGHLREAWACV